MIWKIVILFILMIYIGFDYGRTVIENRRLKRNIMEQDDRCTPLRYIMVGTQGSSYITDLAMKSVNAHRAAGVGIKNYEDDNENGYMKVVFDNEDELLVYKYEKAQIASLTKHEINNYEHKLFLACELPIGAERAIVQQLGLMDYMVNIGICSEKSGGK